MNSDLKNIIINDILNELNYTDWTKVVRVHYKKKYDFKSNSEFTEICKWLVNNYYVESLYESYSHLKLLDLGLEIQENGGWFEYLKQKSDVNEYLVEKEQLEFDNLKLQKENLEYQESIRAKNKQIIDLTSTNLILQNKQLNLKYIFGFIGFLGGFIVSNVKYILKVWRLVFPE